MNKKHRMQKLPIAMAAALAFLAIGAVENAKARPLDIGVHHSGHYNYFPQHRVYGGYGYRVYGGYGYADDEYHPYKHPSHSPRYRAGSWRR